MIGMRLLRHALRTETRNHLKAVRHFSNNSDAMNSGVERDPSQIFISPEVQSLLKELTAVNLDKVFEIKRYQEKLSTPKYKFMTDEEVEIARNKAVQQSAEKLQMPPVLLARKEDSEVLARDPILKGYDPDNSTYVFTDITFGKSDHDRLIVKREPDGTLSKVTWEERDNINQVYFPFPGRKWTLPKMFEPEYFDDLLKREEYIFILDRACVQFEPNHPKYIEITQKTYETINEKKSFDKLRSTRHFGPMAFHLAWSKQIDNLVLECLQKERIDDAVRAIQLLHIIHQDSKSINVKFDGNNHMEFIKNYTNTDSLKQGALSLAIETLEQTALQRQELLVVHNS
ncbi:Hypothetical predicted protein [Cloeon dipterum]|uniref:28S ribosomal protein S22, mitochondrial n=1 Tax=Cloeon dipterum TaxID=197152 RepID=A0A8S1CXX9_9INSE|nr:Hypothetical predicted protein [Cloeon dipterum]